MMLFNDQVSFEVAIVYNGIGIGLEKWPLCYFSWWFVSSFILYRPLRNI